MLFLLNSKKKTIPRERSANETSFRACLRRRRQLLIQSSLFSRAPSSKTRKDGGEEEPPTELQRSFMHRICIRGCKMRAAVGVVTAISPGSEQCHGHIPPLPARRRGCRLSRAQARISTPGGDRRAAERKRNAGERHVRVYVNALPEVLWMALDHKYGSWFDYMEPHVKPTTPAQPFPPPTPSLFHPILRRPRLASHASANVAALYPPLAISSLPFIRDMRHDIIALSLSTEYCIGEKQEVNLTRRAGNVIVPNDAFTPTCRTPRRYTAVIVVCRGEKRSEVHDYTNRGGRGRKRGRTPANLCPIIFMGEQCSPFTAHIVATPPPDSQEIERALKCAGVTDMQLALHGKRPAQNSTIRQQSGRRGETMTSCAPPRNKPYTAVNDPLLLFPFSRRTTATVVQSATAYRKPLLLRAELRDVHTDRESKYAIKISREIITSKACKNTAHDRSRRSVRAETATGSSLFTQTRYENMGVGLIDLTEEENAPFERRDLRAIIAVTPITNISRSDKTPEMEDARDLSESRISFTRRCSRDDRDLIEIPRRDTSAEKVPINSGKHAFREIAAIHNDVCYWMRVSHGFSTRATSPLVHRSTYLKTCKPALRDGIKCRVTRRWNELSGRAVGFEIHACDDQSTQGRNGEGGKCSDANRTRYRRARAHDHESMNGRHFAAMLLAPELKRERDAERRSPKKDGELTDEEERRRERKRERGKEEERKKH
ncbi:hypothetical protein DBV15_01497 [Temnothorax longispinosus]|uniref:Uncharacterized protein n=1 Tax=Temnothorax longispinosus TaxID=300112 RepID=A0A4S2KTQ1_9HYME|nr:hypothetical protein DBV15_01497 [Temnothorax longispinosus]